MQEPIILDSARKRGIPDDDILHAWRNVLHVVVQDDDMVMHIGPTRDGALLEVGVVIGREGDELIVHAMPARRKYLRMM